MQKDNACILFASAYEMRELAHSFHSIPWLINVDVRGLGVTFYHHGRLKNHSNWVLSQSKGSRNANGTMCSFLASGSS